MGSKSELSRKKEDVLAVLNADDSGAWERVGGIPLVARSLFHLKKLGIKKVILLLRTDHLPEDLRRWQAGLELRVLKAGQDLPATILSIPDRGEYFFYIDAAHLIDPRLLRALLNVSKTTLLCMDSSDAEKEVIRAGFLRREDLQTWSSQGKGPMIRRSVSLLPGDIDSFSPEIRGPLPPYFMEVRSKKNATEATGVVIRSQQKQVMDLPAQFIDPPFENALTRFLCTTPVTPNMVTLSGVIVAVGTAWLFWHGNFLGGALCAFVVEILDGVDGKLARTRLRFTTLGHYEDVIDYFYENSWYVALSVGLSAVTSSYLPRILAGLLILSDTADNVFYTLSSRWYGKSIDLFSRFDGAFRRIAGRRNIYTFIFIIGFSLGFPLQTFAFVAVWAALTAALHGLRLFQYGRTDKKISPQEEEADA